MVLNFVRADCCVRTSELNGNKTDSHKSLKLNASNQIISSSITKWYGWKEKRNEDQFQMRVSREFSKNDKLK